MTGNKRFCLAVMACLISGTATAAEPDPAPATQAQIKALIERMDRIETSLQNLLQNQSALNLLKEIEAMKAELSRLRGKDETQDHQLDSLAKRQGDLYVDLDKRVDDLGKQVKSAAAKPTAEPVVVVSAPTVSNPGQQPAKPAELVKPVAKSAEQSEEPLAESKAYEAALNLFRVGNYAGAITGFQTFLKKYPDSALASNAQYWTGYAYYANKDYKNSLEQQKKLIRTWPQSAKVPDALLNIAGNQIELGDLASAKKNLEEIIARYPGTNAAAIASKRLALLK